MSGKSDIEWTEQTWNPTTGCVKVSPGCKHCYAETMARRLKAMHAPGYKNGFEFTIHPKRFNQPLRRKKPTLYFVNSMSDLFFEKIGDNTLDIIFDVMMQTPQHTYQILTKRAARMASYVNRRNIAPNIWLGVSVEDRKYGIPRINYLRTLKASVRFLSCEPLLEGLGTLDLKDIDWVIVGGESGFKARPMKTEWVESIKQQCEAQGVRFFFKQWGTYGPDGIKRTKKANGRKYQDREWNDIPNSSLIQAI